MGFANRITMASDSFTRADNTDIGTAWDVGASPFVRLDLVSNAIQGIANPTNDSGECYNAITLPANQWCTQTIKTLSGANLDSFAVMLRSDATAANLYFTAGRTNTATTGRISKIIAGVTTALGSDTSAAWVSGDVLSGDAIGTAITLYRNGTQVFSVTDSAIASGARAGMIIGGLGIASACVIDDWSCGSFAAPHHYYYGMKPLGLPVYG